MKLSYEHVFQPGTVPTAPPLLLLHGTGGNERDLMPLGRALSPGSAVLSPRGDVNEHGQLRFFRRLAEGVFDLDDVVRRTEALADFAEAAALQYGLDLSRLVAVGFSNGANIAATLLQRRPKSLGGAVLLRAMVVLAQPAGANTLEGKRVLISSGLDDPIVPTDHPERLGHLLRQGGADVDVQLHAGGHGLTAEDITLGKNFFLPS